MQLDLLRRYVVVFIGCSLKDPNVRLILDRVKRECPKQRHYAFLPDPTTKRQSQIDLGDPKNLYLWNRHRTAEKEVTERILEDRGVIPIWWSESSEIAKGLQEVTDHNDGQTTEGAPWVRTRPLAASDQNRQTLAESEDD